ncbi:MAG: hypothetical protein WC967_13140 [Balneolaceae bacterium]
MKIAVLDIDDVSFNLRDGMLAALNKHTGKNMTHDDWHDYNLHGRYGITLQDFFDILHKENVVENSTPEPCINVFTKTLKHNGYKVDFLSARGWHKDALNVTRNAFDEHKVYYDTIHLVDISESKKEFIQRTYGKIDLIVEDSPTHFHSIFIEHELSHNGILINRPWNKLYREENSHCSDHYWESLEQLCRLQTAWEKLPVQVIL